MIGVLCMTGVTNRLIASKDGWIVIDVEGVHNYYYLGNKYISKIRISSFMVCKSTNYASQ